MLEPQHRATLTADDCRDLDAAFRERNNRLHTIFALDRALSAAANRYNLAAEIVHHGWPHRAD